MRDGGEVSSQDTGEPGLSGDVGHVAIPRLFPEPLDQSSRGACLPDSCLMSCLKRRSMKKEQSGRMWSTKASFLKACCCLPLLFYSCCLSLLYFLSVNIF